MNLNITDDLLLPVVGIAGSPIPIIAISLVLGSAKARTNGIAFVLGWISGLTFLSLVLLLVVLQVEGVGQNNSDFIYWIRIILGLILLILAYKKWMKRSSAQKVELPRWMESIDKADAVKSFTLGAALGGLNPKNIAFSLVYILAITEEEIRGSELAIAIMVFVTLSSLIVLGSVIYYLVATVRATKKLNSLKEFMIRNNLLIMTILFLVFGIMLLAKGLTGLSVF